MHDSYKAVPCNVTLCTKPTVQGLTGHEIFYLVYMIGYPLTLCVYNQEVRFQAGLFKIKHPF